MTDTIEEARALVETATPGPWVADGMIIYRDAGIQPHVCEALIRPSDADLIAAAPRLLAALADECELLRARVAVLEAAMPDDPIMQTMFVALNLGYSGNITPLNERATICAHSRYDAERWLARLDAARKGTP